MKKYDIKLIGLDLDGTTLTDDKVLTPRTKNVIEECLRQGIQVMAATGRTRKGLPEYLYEIEGMRYVVYSNGAVVYDIIEDKVVYENCIPWDEALKIFEIIEDYTPTYDYYTEGAGICDIGFIEGLKRFAMGDPTRKVICRTLVEVPDIKQHLRERKTGVEKINMFYLDDDYRKDVLQKMQQYDEFVCVNSIPSELEINGPTCNKGDALINLGRILGITPDQIMACGDGGNDRAMIQMAGLGVAMANANEEVKAVADYITKSNNEEGVAYAIEKFVNLKNE